MTKVSQDIVSSNFFALGDAWAITSSRKMLKALPESSTTEKYFGGVAPICQYERGTSRWIDRAAAIWLSPEDILRSELHHVESAFLHGPQIMNRTGITGDKSAPPLAWPIPSHHFYAARHFYAGRRKFSEIIPEPITAKELAPKLDSVSQRFDFDAKPFMLLERAQRLLSKQQVRDARDVLQLGAASYSEDEKIASLFRAISPGQVKKNKGSTPNRQQEMDWLQKHGHKFRGQWVAVKGDVLVASATTLDELIVEVKRLGDGRTAPIIQKIAPE